MSSKTKQKKGSVSSKNNSAKFPVSPRVRAVTGLLFILFSLYMLLAMFGFFYAGGADQSLIEQPTGRLISDPGIVARNPLGKMGALLSDILINRWFGIPSFVLCYLLFLTGLRIGGRNIPRYARKLTVGLTGMIWFSLLLGFVSEVLPVGYVFPGGAHGYFISRWSNSLIGEAGTLLALIFLLAIWLFFGFKGSYPYLAAAWKARSERRALRRQERARIRHEKEPFALPDDLPEEEAKVKEEAEVKEEEIPPCIREPEEAEIPTTIDLSWDENRESSSFDDVELTVTAEHKEEELKKALLPDEDYDPTLELSRYRFPSLDLLEEHASGNPKVTTEELEANKQTIVETLNNYKIQITKIKATIGPTVTLYEIVPAPGVKISRIKNLEDDIALSLSALGIRIIAPIPGAGTIGIEVPNRNPEIVSMRSIIASKKFQESKYALPVVMGRTISNELYTFDLAKMPHLLVAGATGQGKSVGLNAIITSLLYKKHPSQLKFVMIDPKKVELSIYSVIEKHFLAKLPDEEEAIITETHKVVTTLKSICTEMDNRYDLLKQAQVRNIKEYNEKFVKRGLNPTLGHRYLPYIVVVVDEFADLIMTAGKEVEQPIARIAQLARAIGIHMIIATQRPSTNIITGIIKANFPARIAFKVASMVDSRTILDAPGANHLIGRGDMLISVNSEMTRVQCALVDTPEVDAITDFIASQQGYASAYELPEYKEEGDGSFSGEVDLSAKDPLFDDAARLVVNTQQGSTSAVQRRFSIGYNRAGRIIDQLEAAGIVGPFEGSKPRQVLLSDEYSLEQLLNNMNKF